MGERYYNNATGNSEKWEGTDGAGHVLSAQAGDIVSHATLTLSATSKPLPAAPAGASRVMIQIQGTAAKTDLAWIRLDGLAATNVDMVLRNAEDAVSNTEKFFGGDMSKIRILGTTNAATAVIWWMK